MLFQPGPNALTDVKVGIVLALFAAAIVAYGGWDSMREEGTTFDSAKGQLQSRYGPGRHPSATPRRRRRRRARRSPTRSALQEEPDAAEEPESRPPSPPPI